MSTITLMLHATTRLPYKPEPLEGGTTCVDPLRTSHNSVLRAAAHRTHHDDGARAGSASRALYCIVNLLARNSRHGRTLRVYRIA